MICAPNFSFIGWFSFWSNILIYHQLLTAVDSWCQLIWKKFNWNFHVHTKVYMCAKFQLSRLIFFISCQQVSAAVDSWWQLIWKKLALIYICTLNFICVPIFSSLGWISFLSTVISCWHLLTAIDSWWQLIWKN